MVRRALAPTALLVAVAAVGAACGGSPDTTSRSAAGGSPTPRATPTAPSPRDAAPSDRPVAAPAPRLTVSAGRPRQARLSIPAIGLHDVVVVPYRGHTDDAPGTRIQDGGDVASPYGPHGGVGPGGLGNYQVTGHRTSSTHPFAALPALRPGARVVVVAGGVRYVYEIRRTRQTSFRSARSLAEQRAAVPGRPGAVATRAYLTLSTCATQEDHAAGNFWSDQLHNPEHRIDKIGVLVRTVVVD